MPESKEVPAPRWNKSILITAVVLAVAAVIIVNVWLGIERRRQRQGYLIVEEATRRLEKGQTLVRADLRETEIPPVSAQEAQRYVRREQLAAVLETNRPLARPVPAGKKLEWDDFTSATAEGGVELVEKNFREIFIPLDRRMAPGQRLTAGMYIDLLATIPATASRNQTETIPVLERILVLSVGGKTLFDSPEQRGSYLNISIKVTPEQANKTTTIVPYLKEGFTVTIRNSTDTWTSGKDGLDAALKRLGFAGPPTPAPPPE